MIRILKNASVYTEAGFENKDLVLDKDRVFFAESCSFSDNDKREVIDCTNLTVMPSFVDVHVHLREPGLTKKETIYTGTMAAAAGGYSHICSMPNVNPAPADYETLKVQLDIIEKDAVVNVIPYGTITTRGDGRSSLSDMEAMAAYVAAFSDDGKGVQTGNLMQEAMLEAKRLNKMIVAHCEDESLLHNGYIHKGNYAKKHGHRGICSESEWVQVERDVKLAGEIGCAYHVCHISTKETVDIIRKAKKQGINVSCETAPHYLILTEDDLQEEGRFKMNPPLRAKEDRAALIDGIIDGTIDMIATDHAPHTAEEKSRGLEKSAFGIVGLETAFSLLYTNLVLKNIISLEKLIYLMSYSPAKRFAISGINQYVTDGMIANLVAVDLNKNYKINTENFLSKGRATPFEDYEVMGRVEMTLVNGKIVYKNTMQI